MKTETEFVTVEGVKVAVRKTGTGEPLVLLHRFRGTLDDWDPALLSALARERRVITFDSVGVGESDGEVPDAVEPMADFAASVIRELGLGEHCGHAGAVGGDRDVTVLYANRVESLRGCSVVQPDGESSGIVPLT